MTKWIQGSPILFLLMVVAFSAVATETSKYQIQLTSVESEEEAQQIVLAIADRIQLPLEVFQYQGKYSVVAGSFENQNDAAEAAKDPQLQAFNNLDVVRVRKLSTTLKAGATVFQLQLGNFSTTANAERIRAEALQRGLSPVFVIELNGYYKVRYGQFPTREAATSELPLVHQAGYVDAWIAETQMEQGKTMEQIVSVEPLQLFGAPSAPVVAVVAPGPVGPMAPIQLPSEQESSQPVYREPPQPAAVLWQPQPVQAASVYQPAAVTVPEVVISTQPIGTAQKKTAIPISVKADGVDEVVLHYRLKGGLSYIKVPMTRGENGAWTSEIPAWAVTNLGVEYFIQAKKSYHRYTSDADKDNPYLIQVK